MIELAGLPGVGKSTLARKLSVDMHIPVIRMSSRVGRAVFGTLFFLTHPRLYIRLSKLLKESAKGDKELARSLFLNACLGAGAKYCYARLRGGIIDQGFVQSLIAALPTDAATIAPVLAVTPRATLTVFCEGERKTRKARTREELSHAAADRFEQEAPTAYLLVRDGVRARALTLTLNPRQPTAVATIRSHSVSTSGLHAFGKTAVLLFAAFLSSVYRLFTAKPTGVAILMYHGVDSSGWKHAIPLHTFDKQIAYIARRYHPTTLKDAVEHAKGEKALSARSVVVTFDDGYATFRENVLPVLTKYNVPATLFLTSDLSAPTNSIGTERISLADIQALSQEPLISIESHGVTHRRLPDVSADEVANELTQSQKDIETYTGVRPQYFAYAYGARSSQVEAAVPVAGYGAAVAITEGLVHPGDNVFRLKRIQVDRTMSFLQFALRLTPAIEIHRRMVDWFRAP